jgi:hypothetical protein
LHWADPTTLETLGMLIDIAQPQRPIQPRHQRIMQCRRDVQLRQRAREHIGVAAGLGSALRYGRLPGYRRSQPAADHVESFSRACQREDEPSL